MTDSIASYECHAPEVIGTYEAMPSGRIHAWLEGRLPTSPALLLDVGAGTGRDAVWLASLGHDVVAVEPSAAQLHPEPRIRWLDDGLPDLRRRYASASPLI